jgi:N-acetylglucosaminyldiphosphoundecaprenol N-acetyl-beta-D-mannosaminyltransferase
LGAPKQEIWMLEHKNALNRGVMFGVGAAFDFHAGKLKRAPVWMQVYSLEWLYRLVKEPRRLFRRYFKTNVLFLWYLLRHEIVVSYKHTCQKEK